VQFRHRDSIAMQNEHFLLILTIEIFLDIIHLYGGINEVCDLMGYDTVKSRRYLLKF
jgi:hypothetical protein